MLSGFGKLDVVTFYLYLAVNERLGSVKPITRHTEMLPALNPWLIAISGG